MVGSAICRLLRQRIDEGEDIKLIVRTRDELNLTNQEAVRQFFDLESPDEVILAAARVGGIHANNTYPADFIYDNIAISSNVISQAHKCGVSKLLQLGSSCIYPKNAEQPMSESELLKGELEPTNEPYALAKIAGIKLCESYNRQYGTDFRSVMPTNLYGPGDNFHPENSHVLPALIRRFHQAKVSELDAVVVWGTGSPRREFLHVSDMAAACLFVMDLPKNVIESNVEPMLSHINVGTGVDISILELAHLVAKTVGYKGSIETDPSKPDGTRQKLLDVSRLSRLGWTAEISLIDGLKQTYSWFQAHQRSLRI